MNQWWWWHRSLTLAYFGRNFVCFVIYLPISPQGRPRFELFYRVYLQQPVEFKIVRTEKIITYQTPQSNLPIVLQSWSLTIKLVQFRSVIGWEKLNTIFRFLDKHILNIIWLCKYDKHEMKMMFNVYMDRFTFLSYCTRVYGSRESRHRCISFISKHSQYVS